ncbi:nucleotidyltransferase domain-containing protein [Sphingomonas sp.]|uniref:nucleotidyltransferase domain-containing protein n=1 Tax=Sphingomonas sp. TaxID=28214 RepID=UPI002ED9B230
MAEGEGDEREGGGVRLEPEELKAIKAAAAYAFGPDATIRLFGSRADDCRKGGDIDLHVEVDPDVDTWQAKCRFEDNLFARIEPQRVDVVVRKRGTSASGIDLIAHRDGIAL